MPQPYGKALTNESIYPNIVELAVTAGGLEVELARRIIEFHKLRHIEPRHDMGVEFIRKIKLITAGVFPTQRRFAPSSSSSADR